MFVNSLNAVVEFDRESRMLRQRAMPLAVVIDEAAKHPLWKLELEQGQHRVDPGAGCDQPIELGFRRRRMCSQARARSCHHVAQKLRRDRRASAQVLLQRLESLV